MPGTRGWESKLAGWVGLWGWAGALIVAIGLFVVGLVVSDVGHATIRGRPVLNGRAAIAETARDAHARGATSLDGGMIPCYFAEVGPTYIGCGPVYLSGALNRGWDNFRLRVKSSGSGVTVQPIDGVVLVGPLPHGTPMVGADGVVRLVVAGQGLVRGGSSWGAAGGKLLEITLLWGVGALISIPLRRQSRLQRRNEEADAARRAQAATWWATIGRLPLAPAIVPPRPVFVPPPMLGFGRTNPSGPGTASGGGGAAALQLDLGAPGDEDAVDAPSEQVEIDEEAPHRWTGPAVLLLGSVEIAGWASDPGRRIVVELAAYLACHQERPRTAEEVHAAVWPLGEAKRDVSLDTVRQHLSRLRRALGDEHLPDAGKLGGYQLASTVSSDWFRFQALREAGRRLEPRAAVGVWRDALGLVRGIPFAGVPTGSYGWAWDELIVSGMEAAVIDVAHRMAVACMEQGWPKQADWAAGRGLLAVPTDEELLADRLRAAFAIGGFAQLERAWRDTRSLLGEQATAGPLAEVYEQLRR